MPKRGRKNKSIKTNVPKTEAEIDSRIKDIGEEISKLVTDATMRGKPTQQEALRLNKLYQELCSLKDLRKANEDDGRGEGAEAEDSCPEPAAAVAAPTKNVEEEDGDASKEKPDLTSWFVQNYLRGAEGEREVDGEGKAVVTVTEAEEFKFVKNAEGDNDGEVQPPSAAPPPSAENATGTFETAENEWELVSAEMAGVALQLKHSGE